jgi:enoyl-CoA hydratase
VLALCADLRIASLEGRYGLTEVKVGVPYPQAAIGVVRAELTPHAARKLVLSNQLIDGPEALRLGLFDEVLAPGAVLSQAMELATETAAFPADVYARYQERAAQPPARRDQSRRRVRPAAGELAVRISRWRTPRR